MLAFIVHLRFVSVKMCPSKWGSQESIDPNDERTTCGTRDGHSLSPEWMSDGIFYNLRGVALCQ